VLRVEERGTRSWANCGECLKCVRESMCYPKLQLLDLEWWEGAGAGAREERGEGKRGAAPFRVGL
jgi:hypothetical protein